MKIQSYKIDDFIKNIANERGLVGVLLYGPDAGLVSLRAKDIGKKVLTNPDDPFSSINISDSMLKETPSIVYDEYVSTPMFGGNKLISLRDPPNSVVESLMGVAAISPKTGNFIVVTAGNLEASSGLRKFAENNNSFAALPCYQDDERGMAQIIHQKLREYKFSYPNDLVEILADRFGGNRMIVFSEIEKLSIYKGSDRNLTPQDIEEAIADTSETDIGELVNNFADGDRGCTYKTLRKLYAEGANSVMIVRIFINYFMKLQLMRYQMQKGEPFEAIARKHRIFWKQESIAQRHLALWDLDSIGDFLEKLLELEIKTKSSGLNIENELERVLVVGG